MASSYDDVGEKAHAETFYQKALAVLEKYDDPESVLDRAVTLLNLAQFYGRTMPPMPVPHRLPKRRLRCSKKAVCRANTIMRTPPKNAPAALMRSAFSCMPIP